MATKLLNGRAKEKTRSTNVHFPKNDVKPLQAPKKAFVEQQDLPVDYGSTSITLIARDPNWIYAYWEISPFSIQSVRNIAGDQVDHAAHVIRMYDVTAVDFNGHNANHWFDIEVAPHATNWYINIWTDNASYCADFGLRLSDGRFFALCRSNHVTTPRKVQSWRTEQMWMEVKDSPKQQQQSPFVIGSIHKAQESRAARNSNPAQNQSQKKRKIYLNDEDIRGYYSRLSPLLRDIISRRIAARGAKISKGSLHQPKKKVVTLDEFRISGLTWGQFVKKLLSGASEELVILGASESQPIGASEQSARIAKQRKFFFEIGTELIVYGRTEPDAEVRLEGKIIPLRADGTFTLRFALPDGKIPLGFTAVSNDKVEKREISTAVERQKTRYNP